MLALYTLAIFLSAALLFMVQPFAAKVVLPVLGGSPSVWTTCMLFFQGALLAGYGYSHLAGRLRPRVGVPAHALVCIGALLTLPVASNIAAPPDTASPAIWLLGVLAIAAGAPFFAAATTGPLLQRWFSRSAHRRAGDPYFLYVASNAGSLLGLLAYPLFVEPRLDLGGQARWWSIGFGVFVALVFACGALAMRSGPAEAPRPAPTKPRARSRPRERLLWVGLAFVPSSLMLGCTTYLTTDVASIPLLWVVPLSLYLVTFMLAFSRAEPAATELATRLVRILATAIAITFVLGATQPFAVLIPLHVALFFSAALLCHGKLARLRPGPERLTEFYFMLALGGALGGLFNALLAPLIFTDTVEYPLAIGAASALGLIVGVARHYGPGERAPALRVLYWLAPAGAFGLLFAGRLIVETWRTLPDWAVNLLTCGIPAIFVFLFSRQPIRFATGLAAMLLYAVINPITESRIIHAERNFFGVHRVKATPQGTFHWLLHGTTTHGMQSRLPDKQDTPLTYYHPTGPIGQLFRTWVNGEDFRGEERADAARPGAKVAFIGLGAGALAAYGRPGQTFHFYDIDPAIIRIASDPALFTHVQRCRAELELIRGDGRVMLGRAPDGAYDLIVLDAFSSDSIPAHLLTVESLELYLGKLKPDGVIALHISNRFLELAPLASGLSARLGLAGRIQNDDSPTPAQRDEGKLDSTWVVYAREESHLGRIAVDGRWTRLLHSPRDPVWTDGYSDVVSVIRWWLPTK